MNCAFGYSFTSRQCAVMMFGNMLADAQYSSLVYKLKGVHFRLQNYVFFGYYATSCKYAVTVSGNSLANAQDGSLVYTLKGHAHWVNHMALSTDYALRVGAHDHMGQAPKDHNQAQKVALERCVPRDLNTYPAVHTPSPSLSLYA